MAKMKRSAKLDGVGNVVLEEVDVPQPAEREVLIQLKSSLISRGSEIGGRYNSPSAVDPDNMGYSAAGVVTEVGAGVTELAVGARVGVVAPHAEYVIGRLDADAARHSVVPLPHELSFEQATFLPLTVSSVAWTDTDEIQPTDNVAILGQGLVGSIMLQVVKTRPVGKVIAVDAADLRCRLAEKFGADAVVNCAKQDPVAAVRKLTDGKGADIVIDCVGGKAGIKSFEQAQDMVAGRGKIHLIALYHGAPLPLNASKIMSKIVVAGIRSPKPRSENVEAALELLCSGQVRAKEMITHRFPLSQAKEAFDLLAERLGETMGVMFEYE